jgi:tetratricopeptide (TPR) repeat protein
MFQATQRLRAVFVACAVISVAGCGGAKSRFASHESRAEQYLSQGVFDKAGVEFRNALQIEPRNPRALYLYGRVAEHLGDVRSALGAYQAALDNNADYVAAQAALGRMMVLGNATERALTVIGPGLTRHPDDARLLTVRAAARLQLGDKDGARADAVRAVRGAIDDEDTLALLASVYLNQGDTSQAISLIQAAGERNPSSVELHRVLARLYLAARQPAKSEEELKKIITLAPADPRHRYELARYYEAGGTLEAAQATLEQAAQTFPRDNGAKLVLLDFLARRRSPAQAEKVLRTYIAADPDDAELRLELAALLQSQNNLPQAVAVYDDIISRDSQSSVAFVARDRVAAIRLDSGRVDEAARLLEEVLAHNPRDTEALLLRGDIALRHDTPAAAIVDLRAVVRDRPGAAIPARLLARAYVANGEPSLAEETLRAALEAYGAPLPTKAADTASLRLDLAQILLQAGRAEAAVKLLDQSAREAPQDQPTREALVLANLAQHDLPAARAAAEDLQRTKPTASAGWYLGGLVAQQQNRLEDARREFEHALVLEPLSMQALTALTRLDLSRGDGAAAVARARATALANPQSALAANFLGETLMAAHSYAPAIEPLSQAIGLTPTWTRPYHNLAAVRLALRDAAGAEAAYHQGLTRSPFDPLLTTDLATAYEKQGRPEQAIAQYEGLLAHAPHLELAANNLAMLLITYHTDRRSLDRARQLTAAFAGSNSGALLDTHGWACLKLGDVNEALPVLERAADRSPSSSVIRYHLALAELSAGQQEKARNNLELALADGARFAGSDDARARLNRLANGTG